VSTWLVWDKINGSPEHGQHVEAGDPGSAAEVYAAGDVDGGIDGIYVKGHPVFVRSEASGLTYECLVTVEYEPQFSARVFPSGVVR
jgi:hypothetical protein